MKKLDKKFTIINAEGKQEELQITPEGSMWILAYGYDTVAEWKRVRRKAKLDKQNPSSTNDIALKENKETKTNG